MPQLGAGALAALIGSAVAGTAGTVGSVLAANKAAKTQEKMAKMFQLDEVKNNAFGDDLASLNESVNKPQPNLSLRPGGTNIVFPKRFSR